MELSKRRFDCLAGYSRNPDLVLSIEELAWFSTNDERVIGLVARDIIDGDFSWVALGKDERLRYRAIDVRINFPTRAQAIASLTEALREYTTAPDEKFYQGEVSGPPIDFFHHVRPEQDLHATFRILSEERRYAPARAAISALMRYHEDADGNFVQQFQTTGFDARLWELYLFAAMTELGYAKVGSDAAPDFVLRSPFGSFAMEAVTANAPRRVAVPLPRNEQELNEYVENYIPIKLGRSLSRKLSRVPPYWDLPSSRGLPFVLAIQDFHAPGMMRLIVTAATEYVFGVRHKSSPNGVVIERILNHQFDGLVEDFGFFNKAEAANVSAVIVNPQGTITKFNRIGFLAGFETQNIRMVRTGVERRDWNAADPRPVPFRQEVHSQGYSETWVEGMVVLHNPHARIPLDPDLIPGAAHEFLQDDGRIISQLPPFHPLFSQTQILLDDEAH